MQTVLARVFSMSAADSPVRVGGFLAPVFLLAGHDGEDGRHQSVVDARRSHGVTRGAAWTTRTERGIRTRCTVENRLGCFSVVVDLITRPSSTYVALLFHVTIYIYFTPFEREILHRLLNKPLERFSNKDFTFKKHVKNLKISIF